MNIKMNPKQQEYAQNSIVPNISMHRYSQSSGNMPPPPPVHNINTPNLSNTQMPPVSNQFAPPFK